ncbi:MAG: hypothetical protein ACRD3J_16010 [Thermoanaerobaculia bacterium]
MRKPAPNTGLQRTSLRSPLTRNSFNALILVLVVATTTAFGAGQAFEERFSVFKGYNTLPSNLPLSQEQILQLTLPDYLTDLKESRSRYDALVRNNDPNATEEVYEAAIVASRRSNVGLKKEDFLAVVAEEVRGTCNNCRYLVFGLIDLRRKVAVGSFGADQPSYPDEKAIDLIKRGIPWSLIFRSVVPNSNHSCGLVSEYPAKLSRNVKGNWVLKAGETAEHLEGDCGGQ